MAVDEDPDSQDIDRFDRQDAWCPACGAEVWDQAEFCPSCGRQIGGDTLARDPARRGARARWLVVVAIIVLAAFLLAVLGR